jgi:hypothetical protein
MMPYAMYLLHCSIERDSKPGICKRKCGRAEMHRVLCEHQGRIRTEFLALRFWGMLPADTNGEDGRTWKRGIVKLMLVISFCFVLGGVLVCSFAILSLWRSEFLLGRMVHWREFKR